jgi:hypothetical protein
MDADERHISIREANLFHLHFIDTCMDVMPREVTLHYDGLVATDNGRHPWRAISHLAIGSPLHWGVGREDFRVFGFWISTQRTKQTLAKCILEGRQLFVNVDFVKNLRSVDEKLSDLGGRSVREVVANVEKPLRDPSKEEGVPDEIKKRARKR